jgi:hypothetical protein
MLVSGLFPSPGKAKFCLKLLSTESFFQDDLGVIEYFPKDLLLVLVGAIIF